MYKILIAEDEPLLAGAYTLKFTKAGFEVITVGDGLEIFNVLPEFLPNVILLDLVMPKMGGIEVLKKLKFENSTIPIIVTSNLSTPEMIAECFKLGASDFLIKSNTSLDELIKKVIKLVDNKKW